MHTAQNSNSNSNSNSAQHSREREASGAGADMPASSGIAIGGKAGASGRAAANDRRADGGGGRRRGAGRGRGRGGGSRGRGRGRGGKRGSTRPSFETADFRTGFHARTCRAARYKVHAPLCSCARVVRLREAEDARSGAENHASGGSAIDSARSSSRAYSNEAIQFDVDGSFSQRLTQLSISRGDLNNNGNSSSNNSSNNKSDSPFDNLIVVPDTKSTPAIYVCEGTDSKTFQKDGTACEKRLANEIFGAEESSDVGVVPPFKVSCAICLLARRQRNGFVAVVSRRKDEMQRTLQRARDAAAEKLRRDGRRGLHADHAHFVCAAELSSLRSLHAAGKMRGRDRRVVADVARQLEEGGAGVPAEILEAMASSDGKDPPARIKMGHHLTSLLWLLQNESEDKQSMNDQLRYMMVLGYVDGPRCLELDLPGGKRHLGESTLQGAIREVEEECSLRIHEGWFAGMVSREHGGVRSADDGVPGEVRVLAPRRMGGQESGDAFFVMSPPPPP